ncbi:MAG TPA: lipoyl(octanoyl) transferase LipB [Clostridia bacterium]|nr:lipoyl(octanoyl) transferase LipB [Clostridia bacterium]
MWTWLGPISYAEALALQRSMWQARYRGEIPDWLLLLEHVPPVVTFGRDGGAENLKIPPHVLKERGVEVYEAERGGNVTYHGPGQIVGYAIIDLREHGRDILKFLRAVEESLISVLAKLGIAGHVDPEHPGVWVDVDGKPSKIAAVGISIRRWVTMHGFSLNVTTDEEDFDPIIPCGIRDRGVTSVAALIGRDVPSRTLSPAVPRAASRRAASSPVSRTDSPSPSDPRLLSLEALGASIACELARYLSLTPRKARPQEVRLSIPEAGEESLAAR